MRPIYIPKLSLTLAFVLFLPTPGTAGICDPGPPCVDSADIIKGQVGGGDLTSQSRSVIIGTNDKVEPYG